MVLFLVAMAVTLLAVTSHIRQEKKVKDLRNADIASCIEDIRNVTQTFQGVSIRGHTIDFGSRATFENNSHVLQPDQQDLIRGFVPRLLEIARHPKCERWLKEIVVDGFASRSGTYIFNLNLSLQRSERILCVLLDASAPNAPGIVDRRLIRKLFLVGGSSFNSIRQTDAESRRIEFRLNFREPAEERSSQVDSDVTAQDDAHCPIDRP
jgi:outer membrane protein OmpA-like peptidoglycan-associated protein